jgi:catechol 2,3-dioxygenase-like lactoylglutathione lyase family enzyme
VALVVAHDLGARGALMSGHSFSSSRMTGSSGSRIEPVGARTGRRRARLAQPPNRPPVNPQPPGDLALEIPSAAIARTWPIPPRCAPPCRLAKLAVDQLEASDGTSRHRQVAHLFSSLVPPVGSPALIKLRDQWLAGRTRRVTINRAVPNIRSDRTAETRDFFVELLGFEVAMDMGWIVTVASPTNPSVQVSIIGNDDAAAPGISVEVADVDAVHARAVERGLEIAYSLRDEEWGVRRFMLREPSGTIVNVLSHRPG